VVRRQRAHEEQGKEWGQGSRGGGKEKEGQRAAKAVKEEEEEEEELDLVQACCVERM
jgi:hypothetical protein